MKTPVTHATVDKNLSILLDFFRWFSALVVVVTHSRAIFFVPWGEVTNKDLISTAFYFVSGWGDYGVLMFFALSGFLIGGGAYERIKVGNFSFADYFINRFTRIYIVLLPALLFVWALDVAGLKWLNGSGIYTQGYPIGAMPLDTRDAIGPTNFVFNLLMLQNIVVPPFGTAQQLWSLNWEWWSYMLAPFVIGLLARFSFRWVVMMSGVLSIACALSGLGYMLLWHVGILLAFLPFRFRRTLVVLSVAICLLIPVATRAMLLPTNLATQLVFILGFVLLLSQLRQVSLPVWWGKLPNKWLADFSYSLYLLHITIMAFLMACLQTFLGFERQLQPGAINYGKYLLFVLVVYAISYVFARLTEANTGALRRLIRRHAFGRRDASYI